jgi:integrase
MRTSLLFYGRRQVFKEQHKKMNTYLQTNQIEAFATDQKLNGRSPTTITTATYKLKLLASKCDINNPYEAKEYLANCKYQKSTIRTFIYVLTAYYNFIGKKWKPPKIIVPEKVIYVPPEENLDILIAGATRRTSPLLQFLKETATRIGEATQVQWTDIEPSQKTVAINHPEKGSLPRLIPISTQLIELLNTLPKKTTKVFTSKEKTYRISLERTRKQLATKLNKPELIKIHFHTFRHWKATMTFIEMGDGYYVRQLLGHKTSAMTDRYIHIAKALILSKDRDKYVCKVATTPEEALDLGEKGFTEYSIFGEKHLFRKLK